MVNTGIYFRKCCTNLVFLCRVLNFIILVLFIVANNVRVLYFFLEGVEGVLLFCVTQSCLSFQHL